MNSKTRFWRILSVVLLLPLLFINVKDTHDWGDDFAQYLIQARNICEGRPQTDNGLLFFANQAPYAIEAYPMGFPLMIAPLYSYYHLQLSPYMVLIAVFLVLTGIICYEFFSRHENAMIAFLITMLFCYNPTVLDLKKQILSELPFTCFLMLSLLLPVTNLYKKKSSWVWMGLTFGILISLRLIGTIALAAYALTELNKFFRKQNERPLTHLALTTATAIIFFCGLNGWIFKLDISNLFGFYSSALKSNTIHSAINFDYYYDVLKNFFPFWSISVSAFWLITAFTGWLIRFIKFRTYVEYFFPLYLILIIFYPYSNGGYRLLLPVLPLLIFYFYYFLSWLFYWFGKKQHKITPAILGLCLLAYLPNVYATIKNQHTIENGPQRKDAIEMFTYLRTIPADVPIMFSRARAMYLYSGHVSLYPIVNQDYETVNEDLRQFKDLLLVISTNKASQSYDKRIVDFINKSRDSFESIWKNDGFQIYRKIRI